MIQPESAKVDGAKLVETMLKALRLPTYPKDAGECEKFQRLVFLYTYGDLEPIYHLFDATAARTAENFSGTVFDVWNRLDQPGHTCPVQLLKPGDLLYKDASTSGIAGHVGMFFHNVGMNGVSIPSVGENSHYQLTHTEGQISGAKGVRSLAAFGNYNLVVRLSNAGGK